MAIVTGDLYKGFTFGDISSKAYGVYITQEAAYNAPERDVSVYEIAGRNGAYVLDNGRFRNITVTYKCGIALDSETDFEAAIRVFRNALASQAGKYVRLTDEYNPNEYRQAAFLGGIEVEMADRRAGEFTVSFDCKPQRFLTSGEIPRTIGGSVTDTQTKSGAVVSMDSDGGDAVTSLVAQIEPVQAGSGDPSPTNVRAITGQTSVNAYVGGKNILRINRVTTTVSGVTFTINSDGSVHVEGTTTANNVFLNLNYSGATKIAIPTGTWKAKVGAGASGNVRMQLISNDVWRGNGGTSDFNSITIPEGSYNSWCRLQIQNSGTTVNETLYPMICADTETDSAFKGYDGKFITTALGRTVYGGTVDVVTGVLTVTHEAVDLGTLSWTLAQASGTNYFRSSVLSGAKIAVGGQTSAMCSAYKPISGTSLSYFLSQNNVAWTAPSNISTTNPYACIRDERYSDAAAFKTAVSGVLLVYELATPQTYQLTAQQVELLAGQNNVWADTGDISITYGRDPNKLVNPTLFESRPLLMVNGYGDISLNSDTVTVQNVPIGEITIAKNTSKAGVLNGTTAVVRTTATIVEGLLETGDTFTVKAQGGSSVCNASMASNQQIVDSVSFRSAQTSINIESVPNYHDSFANQTAIFKPVSFVYGTSKTAYCDLEVSVTAHEAETPANSLDYSFTIAFQMSYNGQNTITLRQTIGNASTAISGNLGVSYNAIVGVSSKSSLGDPLYIDLEIGEAYKEEDGDIISSNTGVYLPAELPTLKSGVNRITTPNTITKLDIVPRWWEV